MKVFVIRHGESETNRDDLWTGWLDAPLTEKGRADAALAGELLSHTHFDKIYSSDLCRAASTAEIAIPGCEYEKRTDLREICLGSLEGLPKDYITAEQKATVAKEGYASLGGESFANIEARMAAFVQELEKLDCERVAIFTHAGWQRRFLDFVLGMKHPRKNIYCKNCAVGIFEYKNSVWVMHSWINLQ